MVKEVSTQLSRSSRSASLCLAHVGCWKYLDDYGREGGHKKSGGGQKKEARKYVLKRKKREGEQGSTER